MSSLGVSRSVILSIYNADLCVADTKYGRETLNAFGTLRGRFKTIELLFKPSIFSQEH